jgi:hypothetical protein
MNEGIGRLGARRNGVQKRRQQESERRQLE